MNIKLIAFDLDGTLLGTEKDLPALNHEYMQKAADHGIFLVPSTGRFYTAIPKCVRSLPFIRYAITINGAEVIDSFEKKSIYRCEIPLERALELIDWCRTLDVAYDCYIDSLGYMESYYIDHIENYLDTPIYCSTVRAMRIPVDDLQEFVISRGRNVQKIQMFTNDRALLKDSYKHIYEMYPDIIPTSSLNNNLEMNAKDANKGSALRSLAAALGIDPSEVMAVGDGGNDLPMFEVSGVRVAMANSIQDILDAATFVTLDNDKGGVGYAIKKLVFEEE